MNDKTQERAASCKCTKVPPVCPQYKNGVCIAFSYCQHKRPFTNADRIRAMSDEELAQFAIMSSKFFCTRKEPEPCEKPMLCTDCALAWLQQPAQEEG